MVFLVTMKNPSWISWQPLKCHKWFSWQQCHDHTENPDTSSIVNRYVSKRLLPVVVKTSFVHGVLGNHEKPSWISWQQLKYHKWFSWQPWQYHAGIFFMASMVPYMALGYGSQERSTRALCFHLNVSRSSTGTVL